MSVLFATNRAQVPGSMAFSDRMAPEGAIYWGIAERQGLVMQTSLVSPLAPSPGWQEAFFGAESDLLLVSLHGFGYHFEDSMDRAEQLIGWFAGASPSVLPTVIAYAWPSLGTIGLAHYTLDRERSADSAPSFRNFLRNLAPLVQRWRRQHPAGRVALLAHSMGNHFLHYGLKACFADGALDLAGYAGLFDVAISAGGDESDRAFEPPDAPHGLYALTVLAKRTVVLFNEHDHALEISCGWNLRDRIGHVGARDKVALQGHPICFVDCSAVDGFLEDPEGHQYYRCVPEIRDLIAAEFHGSSAWQGRNAAFRPATNDWELDLPASVAAAAASAASASGPAPSGAQRVAS